MLQSIKDTALEVIQAIIPLTLAITILQLTIVRMPAAQFLDFLIGALMVMVGMVFFLIGVKIGLLPIGSAAGAGLPKHGLPFIIVAVFLIGFSITIAEPNVLVLTRQIGTTSSGAISGTILLYVIAIGIGFLMAVAILRVIFGVPIKYLFAGGYAGVTALSFLTRPEFVPIAYDAGGFSTGMLTVPFILALGVGFSSVLAGKSALSDGFGLVGLASMGPVYGVMIIGIVV